MAAGGKRERTTAGRGAGAARRGQRELAILKLVQKIGPDINEISNITGIPRETARYLYKRHILKKRIRVLREIDYDKLGLSCIQFLVKFPAEADNLFDSATGSFTGLWENIYASFVYRIIPENYRFIGHLAPPSLHPRLEQFYERLEQIGLCRVIETYHADRLIHNPMWLEQYDIERNAWDFDWELKGRRAANIAEDPPVSEPVELDRTDIEIITTQALDPDANMSALAARMKMKQPTFAYHWREHLVGRGIVKGWNIRWLGTDRDPKTGQILRRHSSAAISVVARGLSPVEMMNFRAQLHSIPFLWGEKVGAGSGEVVAETLVPGNQLVDYFDFLGKITAQLEGKVRIMMVDQSAAFGYTVNPHLFDEARGGWLDMGDLVLKVLEKAMSDYAPSGEK